MVLMDFFVYKNQHICRKGDTNPLVLILEEKTRA